MRFSISLGAVIALALTAPTHAVVTQLTAPNQFTGPITTITFDDVPAADAFNAPYTGVIANTRYAAQGVTFSEDNPGNIAIYTPGFGEASTPNILATVGGPIYAFDSVVNLTFTGPVTEVGAFFGNDQNPSAFNAENLIIYDAAHNPLGNVTVATNDNFALDQYIGLRSTVPFYFARFENIPQPNAGLSVLLDNVSFTTQDVPEPASLALLSCGMLLLIRRRQ